RRKCRPRQGGTVMRGNADLESAVESSSHRGGLSTEQAHCREKLTELVQAESGALNELSALLEREHRYLEANDVLSLEGATRERQRCVARILRVDEQRRALCSTMGFAIDLTGLEELIRWCDPGATLAEGWTECSTAAARCRWLNDRNGALVAARLK